MTSENDDRIFDAFLEEALGKRQPPDLAPRILKAWAEKKNATHGDAFAKLPKINGRAAKAGSPRLVRIGSYELPELVAAEKSSAAPSVNSQKPLPKRDRFSRTIAIALAASIVGIGFAVGWWGLQQARQGQPLHQSIAAQPAPTPDDHAKLPGKASAPAQAVAASKAMQATAPADAPLARAANELAANDNTSSASTEPIAEPKIPPAIRQRRTDAEIVASINNELGRLWVAASVKPTSAVSDQVWCQRLFQGLLGRAPRPAELSRSLDQLANEGRETVVHHLLSAPRYKQEFAQHWAANWATRLLGPRGGLTSSLASRGELEAYLAKALVADKPVDEVVRELLIATGSPLPESAEYNPAVNFLLDRWDASGVQATGRVARILLGHDLQCAQCHQHPTAEWTQEQFWSLNAFFRQMRVERSSGSPRVVNVDFAGQRRGSRDGEVFFETPTGLMKSAFPRFLDGTEISTSGMLSVVDRRLELARLVTRSQDFKRTMVNDVWKQLLSYGLESNGVSDSRGLDAGLLDSLATEFGAGDCDLSSLVRWIVLSEPFSRSSQVADLATKDLPEAGEPAYFTRFYERRQSPGDATRLLVAASRIRATDQGASARRQARLNWLVQANQSAATGKKGKKTEKKPASSILAEPVAPSGLNSPVSDRGLIAKLIASPMPFENKVVHLFSTAIARPPTQRETRTVADLLAASSDDQAGVLEDVWWSLVNSSECVLER